MMYKHKEDALANHRRSYHALMAIPAYREKRAEKRRIYMREFYRKSSTQRANVRRRTKAWGIANKEWRNFCNNLYRYRITLDQYHAKLESQDFLCALCREAEPAVIDHDHKTGKVRGLLCWSCNSGFGQLKESPELFTRAIEYARKWY